MSAVRTTRPLRSGLSAVAVLALVAGAGSGCITRVENSDDEQQVVVVTSTTTPPAPTTRRAAATSSSSAAPAPRAVVPDYQAPQNQYQNQNQGSGEVEHAAPPAPSNGRSSGGGAPLMEQGSMGPYASAAACNDAASRWPVSHGDCYKGADGGYYFTGMRQKLQR